MTSNIAVSRDASDAPEATTDFYLAVQDGRDEDTEVPGGYGSYPKIHILTVLGQKFYVFDTDLPEEREPWQVGFRLFTRDSVINADTLEDVDEAGAAQLRAIFENVA